MTIWNWMGCVPKHSGSHAVAGPLVILIFLTAVQTFTAAPAVGGEFSLDWDVEAYPPGSSGPVTFTLTDQHGFESRATIRLLGSFARLPAFPDGPAETSTLGGGVRSIVIAVDPPAGGGAIDDSRAGTQLRLTTVAGTALPVQGLSYSIVDIDSDDADAPDDRCDFLELNGNGGLPTITAATASPTYTIGPGAGAGFTGPIAANQVQCTYVEGPLAAAASDNDANGTINVVHPDGTSVASVIYDESIENVRAPLTPYDPGARFIGLWANTSYSVAQAISLVKTSNPGSLPGPGEDLSFTYVITNEGPLPFNTSQDLVVVDDSGAAVSCPDIIAPVQPGETVTCTADYTVTASDILGGGLTSTAVAGIGPIGQAFEDRLQSNTATLDILYALGFDYGDAPATYLAPSHAIVTDPTLFLGDTRPDAELLTQSDATATGDDITGTNDEDGVSLPVLTQGQIVPITVKVAGSGHLQAWMDFNGNGVFGEDAIERIATDLRDDGLKGDVTAGDGEIQLSVTVPDDATTNRTFGRFRWASETELTSFAPTLDGEVEDYSIVIVAADLVDRGDAPATYGDPRHAVVPEIYLGAGLPDTEASTRFSADASLDDTSGIDDEDAISSIPTFVAGSTVAITVQTHETLSLQLELPVPPLGLVGITNLQMWIDFNGNGVFDPSEQVAVDYRDGGTGDADGSFNNQITLNVTVPPDAQDGATFMRIRWSTTSGLVADAFDGLNLDGEVEDYPVMVVNTPPAADLSLTLTALNSATGLPITAAAEGDVVDWAVTVTNDGSDQLSGVQVLSLIPDGFSYVSNDAAEIGGSYDAGSGVWGLGAMPSGATQTLTIRTTVRAAGARTGFAEIIASPVNDPDSDPSVGAAVDDLGDGIADDDEASHTVALNAGHRAIGGRVFLDNGADGGVAHDAALNGAEAGTGDAQIVLRNGGGVVLATPEVAADGRWSYALDAGYSGELTVSLDLVAGLQPISEATDDLPGLNDTDPHDGGYTFSPAEGTDYPDLDFGAISRATLTQDQTASIEAGQVVTLRHDYRAHSAGTAVFRIENQRQNPAGAFAATIYRDDDCDGDPGSALTAPVQVNGETRLCLVSRVTASSAMSAGGRYSYDIVAETAYSATTVATLVRNTDQVSASIGVGRLELTKTVRNETRNSAEGSSNAGSVGDILEYRLYLNNPSAVAAADVVIYDKTPAYTVLADAVPSPVILGSGLSCSLEAPASNLPGYAGPLRWTCSGNYAPSDTGSLSFRVRIVP